MRQPVNRPRHEPPILLVKWYDLCKWLLERVESFPKNQRFVFGQRLADRPLGILELLVEAAYSPLKADQLAKANRELEVLRWLIRMAMDRQLRTGRQYEYCCLGLNECGRMLGGWWKQAATKEQSTDAPRETPL
jgi:hypothetical protein